MANSIQGILAQKQAQQKQKTSSQQKGKPTQLPPSVQSLNPSELKQFLALAFVKFMRSKMDISNKPKRKIFQEEPALKAHLDALTQLGDNQPTLQTKKVFSM